MRAHENPGRRAEDRLNADLLRSLDGLAEISHSFATTLDIEETLQNAAARIIGYLDAEAASVFLLDADAGELVCRASAGPPDALITGLRVPKKRGVVGRTLSSGKCQIVRDVSLDPDFNRDVDRKTGFVTRSIMSTPLQVGDNVFGVLQVLNKRGKPGLFSEQDLDVLRALGSAIALSIHNAQMAEDLMEQRRIRQELDLARELQQRLLPARQPVPFPLAGINLPAYEVSGDFYDHYVIDEHRVGFTVGDVSGKGINAALLMVRTTTLLRSLGRVGLPLGELLQRVNAELCETGSQGMFVCTIAGIYDRRSDEVVLCNAGFPPPLLRNAKGRFTDVPAEAPPLGILADARYAEQRFPLAGGALYMYTDGVTEARNARNVCLGVAGLCRLIRRSATLPLHRRLADLVGKLQTLNLRDDTTLLILEAQPGSERLLELEVQARPEELRRVRAAVGEAVRCAGCPETLAEELVLAVDEACANIIRHAYSGDASGRIVVSVEREGDGLVFRLRDFAPAVNASQVRPKPQSAMRPGGLGIHFIDTIMDSWGFETPEGGGNLLVMKKNLGQAKA